MPYFLRKLVDGNPYINEDVSGIFKYKYSDTIDSGYEEAHLTGDTNTQEDCELRWGATAEDDTLEGYKQLKYAEIDAKTGSLIVEGGFTYAGKKFSLKETAQLNLLGVQIKRNDPILPITFNNVDNTDTQVLATPTDVDNFFMSALGTKKGHLDSGTALKDSVRAAVDKAGVDAVIDNR